MVKKFLEFDEVGYWSELKLDIIKAYATEYSKIISNKISNTSILMLLPERGFINQNLAAHILTEVLRKP